MPKYSIFMLDCVGVKSTGAKARMIAFPENISVQDFLVFLEKESVEGRLGTPAKVDVKDGMDEMTYSVSVRDFPDFEIVPLRSVNGVCDDGVYARFRFPESYPDVDAAVESVFASLLRFSGVLPIAVRDFPEDGNLFDFSAMFKTSVESSLLQNRAQVASAIPRCERGV